MSLLKGFPPSNLIHCTTHLPFIREKRVKITEVPVEGRFKHVDEKRGAEFMMLTTPMDYRHIRAVCYKRDDYTVPGHIYGFGEDTEVIWYEEYRPTSEPSEPSV